MRLKANSHPNGGRGSVVTTADGTFKVGFDGANNLHGDLFISVHHNSVPDNLKETWQYEGKKYSYSDRFSGYAIFVSNDNADRAASLAFGHSLGQELQKHGLHYTPHYTLPLMGDIATN